MGECPGICGRVPGYLWASARVFVGECPSYALLLSLRESIPLPPPPRRGAALWWWWRFFFSSDKKIIHCLRDTRSTRQESGGTDNPAVVLTSDSLNSERDLDQLRRVRMPSPMPNHTITAVARRGQGCRWATRRGHILRYFRREWCTYSLNVPIAYWVIPPTKNAEFVAHMEDILDLYARVYDPMRPVVLL